MSARTSYAVPRQHTAEVPDRPTHHRLTRFTAGVNARRLAEVARAGGIDAWFEQQLVPGPDVDADRLRSWFPDLSLTPLQRWQANEDHEISAAQLTRDLASWVMLRRLLADRQVEEMMVDFWSTLLHVASPADDTWVYRVEYEDLVRQHALGRFDDLLQATVPHPCLGLYTHHVGSNATSNDETLGRQVLEYYSVGADAGYTEADVTSSARILTGFRVDDKTWEASYLPADHWVGRVKVMGFSSPNSKPDGRGVLRAYLSYLAHHPATAQRLCRRLAVRFVSDTPSADLVDSLAQVYLDWDTAIVPVLRALVASDEFKVAGGRKIRTPVEDAVATWCALDVTVAEPHQPSDAGNQFIVVSSWMGQVIYDWPTPDGFPDLGADWTGPARVLGSMRLHASTAGGWWPRLGITYRTPLDWAPTLPTTFDVVVDHVVRTTLFIPCTPTMLLAACVATDCQPTEVIGRAHPLITRGFPSLLVSILDTPEHVSR